MEEDIRERVGKGRRTGSGGDEEQTARSPTGCVRDYFSGKSQDHRRSNDEDMTCVFFFTRREFFVNKPRPFRTKRTVHL